MRTDYRLPTTDYWPPPKEFHHHVVELLGNPLEIAIQIQRGGAYDVAANVKAAVRRDGFTGLGVDKDTRHVSCISFILIFHIRENLIEIA